MSNELFIDEVEPDWTDKDAKRWLEALGYGADFAAKQHDWRLVTPLHEAARMGHMGMIKWLGERGADVSAVDTYGKTPSHLAAWNGHHEALEWLLDKGAIGDLAKPDRNGRTPQMLACAGGHVGISAFLFDRGSKNGGSRVYVQSWQTNKGPLVCFDD